MSSVLVATLVLGLLLIGVAAVLFHILGDSFLKGLEPGPYYLMIAFLPSMLLARYVISVFRGLRRPQIANILDFLRYSTYLGLLVALFLSAGAAVELAVAAYVSGWAVCAAAGIWILWALEGWRPRLSLSKATLMALVFNGAQVSVILMLGFFNRKISAYLINGYLGPADVGLFVVAVTFAEVAWIFPDAVGHILFPLVSSQSAEKSNKTTPQMSRLTVIVAGAMALGVGVVGAPAIPLLYGDDFASAVVPLVILLPGVAIMSVHKVLWRDMMGRGKPLLSAFSRGMTLVVLIGLIMFLVPHMGLAGVAFATSVSFTAGTAVMVFVFCRKNGVSWAAVVVPQPQDFRLIATGLLGFAGGARLKVSKLIGQTN